MAPRASDRNGPAAASEKTLREFKFVVQPVFLVFEGDKLSGEHAADPLQFYGLHALRDFVDNFDEKLAELNVQVNLPQPTNNSQPR
jgi:hypothetical protein